MAPLAIIWHVVFYGMLIALVAGWRPSARFIMAALALPVLSVGVVAWLFGNPFNGTIFILLSILTAIFGCRGGRKNVTFGSHWKQISGWLMIIFGLIYPHFLHAGSPVSYLYKSPLGLIPCPTLSAVIGLALILDNIKSRAWHIVLLIGGFIYGFIGAFVLGVTIDLILLAGAVLLATKLISDARSGIAYG